jgi:hypothetical protein
MVLAPLFICRKCNHKWFARRPYPKTCAYCKTKYWLKPKKKS